MVITIGYFGSPSMIGPTPAAKWVFTERGFRWFRCGVWGSMAAMDFSSEKLKANSQRFYHSFTRQSLKWSFHRIPTRLPSNTGKHENQSSILYLFVRCEFSDVQAWIRFDHGFLPRGQGNSRGRSGFFWGVWCLTIWPPNLSFFIFFPRFSL